MGLAIAGIEHACVVCDARLTIYCSVETPTGPEPPCVRVDGSVSWHCPDCKRKRPFKAVLEE